MRPAVRQFVHLAVEVLGLKGPCFEFGSYQTPHSRADADFRKLFPLGQYTGCDLRPGPGVDRLEDLHRLKLPDGIASTVLCLDTLEHVRNPVQAVSELLRVLAPGGTLVLSVPLDFPIHAHPDDYWRLTPSCVMELLSPLTAVLVGWQGWAKFPHTVYALGFKAPLSPVLGKQVAVFMERFADYLAHQRRKQSRWVRIHRAMLSPLWPKHTRLQWKHTWEVQFSFCGQVSQQEIGSHLKELVATHHA